MTKRERMGLLIAAAGTVIAAGAASAQQHGGLVNISGATLLENWSASRASTNDYIDVDGDGIAGWLGTTIGGLPDQLADGGPAGFGTPGSPTAQELVIQYRVTGSVNGFIELLQFGSPHWVTTDSFDPAGILGADIDGPPVVNPGRATTAYHNRVAYITQAPNTGQATGAYNQGNPGGAPNRADMGTYVSTYSSPHTPSAGGIQIDIAPLDVSTFLAVQKAGGTPSWALAPSSAGYGRNPRNSVNKQGGTGGANLSSQLPTLGTRNLFDPGNPGAADSNTIFDTDLLFAPIAPVVNFGTGVQRLKVSEIQYHFTTGRGKNGENLVVVTRDVGSGTRNGFNNCTGVDPSWGNGDNIGPRSSGATQNNLGAGFIPSNKNGNGDVEATLRNIRLGLGYVGTERGVTGSGSGSWLTTAALEIADTMNDIYGGTQYVRPTTANILHNSPDGWLIGGQAVIATVGDPRASAPAAGGTGWAGAFDPYTDLNGNNLWDPGEPYVDLNGNGSRDATNAEAGLVNSNPAMANSFAARYLNNISRSIAAFNEVPADVANVGMPGEYAASQFLALAAMDNLHSNLNYLNLAPNPGFNQKVQDYIANPLNGNVHFRPEFLAFNTNAAGKAPTRTTGAVYSDGVAGGQYYVNQKPIAGGGDPDADRRVSYAGTLHLRNKVAFDFDGDGQRTIADATDMIRAWRQRNGGPAWSAPDGVYGSGAGLEAIIEVLGDAEGDGNFNRLDVRYWADGLALVSGNLDRRAGFTAVDNASQAVQGNVNFFGTVLATGKIYAPGDSRGDVANASGLTTRGWAPIGADRNNGTADPDDNTVDASDIDYVYRQFRQNPGVTDGAANWSNLNEAVTFDLSADMTGDMIVNQADVTELVEAILGTRMGDVNLDGSVTPLDCAIAASNLGLPGGWASGDVDGDGAVTTDDIALILLNACAADFNGSGGTPDDADVAAFFSAWNSGDPCADANGSGGTPDDADIAAFFAQWNAGGC